MTKKSQNLSFCHQRAKNRWFFFWLTAKWPNFVWSDENLQNKIRFYLWHAKNKLVYFSADNRAPPWKIFWWRPCLDEHTQSVSKFHCSDLGEQTEDAKDLKPDSFNKWVRSWHFMGHEKKVIVCAPYVTPGRATVVQTAHDTMTVTIPYYNQAFGSV